MIGLALLAPALWVVITYYVDLYSPVAEINQEGQSFNYLKFRLCRKETYGTERSLGTQKRNQSICKSAYIRKTYYYLVIIVCVDDNGQKLASLCKDNLGFCCVCSALVTWVLKGHQWYFYFCFHSTPTDFPVSLVSPQRTPGSREDHLARKVS